MQIEVYATKTCPHCKDVAKYLKENHISYSYIIVGEDITPVDLGQRLNRVVRSVPVIVYDGHEVTFPELKEHITLQELRSSLDLDELELEI